MDLAEGVSNPFRDKETAQIFSYGKSFLKVEMTLPKLSEGKRPGNPVAFCIFVFFREASYV
jgi:hypothetical protein